MQGVKKAKSFWESGEKSVRLEILGTPPTGNMYIRHSRGRHYRTTQATRFYETVALLAGGRKVCGKKHMMRIEIYLAPKQKGDLDNFLKCAFDAIVKAGILKSDASVTQLFACKDRAKTADGCKTIFEISELS